MPAQHFMEFIAQSTQLKARTTLIFKHHTFSDRKVLTITPAIDIITQLRVALMFKC